MASTSWRVAVIGAGPAGMFVTEALSARPDVHVDVFERLFAPDGLLRYGVAPDHPSIKRLAKSFNTTRTRPNVRLRGGVEYGKDVTLAQLQAHYHAVVFAIGASSDRTLGIPGESLPGSVSAREFVEWYNAHPDAAMTEFPLQHRSVVVVGAGNVALDVSRVLARPAVDLHPTDIAQHALDSFLTSAVEEVHVLIRRGPTDVSFTLPEARELASMAGVRLVVDAEDLTLDARAQERMAADRGVARIVETLQQSAANTEPAQPGERTLTLHFYTTPLEVLGESRVTAVRCIRNRMTLDSEGTPRLEQVPGSEFTIEAGLLLRSIGYRVSPVEGLPYDDATETIANRDGQVMLSPDTPMAGVWVTGWARRGPSGVIGTNKADAQEVATRVLAGFLDDPPPRPEMDLPGHPIVDQARWSDIDAAERRVGEASGRARRKFVSLDEANAHMEDDS